MEAGVRDLKNHLSRYIRRIEAGERIAVTAHGRVVAEIVPPSPRRRADGRRRFEDLVAAGVIRPAIEPGDPAESWPILRLPKGTVADLVDSDRGEA